MTISKNLQKQANKVMPPKGYPKNKKKKQFQITVDTLANRCYTCINKLRNTKKRKGFD